MRSSYWFIITCLLILSSEQLWPQASVVHFMPMPEQDLYNSFKQVTDGGGATIAGPLKTYISVVGSENGTIIYYDHWEDGYEANITSPVQSTTKIYGDGNTLNGNAADLGCTSCAGDLINAGYVLVLKNDVPIPRNPSQVLFDGRDKMASTRYVSVSRAVYPATPGTVLADATEVMDTSAYDLEYYSPVGVNLATSVDNDMFALTQMFIMAANNATTVQVDADANGSFELSFTLNQGENYRVLTVNAGARVLANKPVQVDLFTSRPAQRFENRWFTLYPFNLWDNSYYCPITSTTSDDPASVFLFNPSAITTITVNWVTRTTSGTIQLLPKETKRYDVPSGTGVRFYTTNESHKFFAVGAMDTDLSNNATHDWGMTLLPESYLTPSLVVGLGIGSASPTVNGNPVWVIATAATKIYVDYDGNPATGANTDPNGNKYNVSYSLAAYESKRIFDPDNDQSGMRIYTVDGTRLAAAWGQDPATAGCCDPYLDMGTTISPDLRMIISKESVIIKDSLSNGLVDKGDSILYIIKLENFSLRARSVVTITDTLSSFLTYAPGSATKTLTTLSTGNSVTTVIPDNPTPATLFPMDEAGYALGDLVGATRVEIKYKVKANSNVNTQAIVTNYVGVSTGQGETFLTNEPVPVNNNFKPCNIDFRNSTYATPVASYVTNTPVYVVDTATYMNTDPLKVDTIIAVLANTTTPDQENIILIESGVNTGAFRGTLPTSTTTGGGNNDGTLKAIAGDNITVTYTNVAYNNICTDNATIILPSFTKQLYLTTDGTDSDQTGSLDRIDPIATSDNSTSSTALLQSTSTGAVTYGATYTGSSNNGDVTISNVSTSGTDKFMMVGISWAYNNTADQVNGVTFGTTAMTKLGTTYGYSQGNQRVDIFYLINPAAGPNNVVVDFQGGHKGAYVGVSTFTGVHQTTPLGTRADASGDNTTHQVTVASVSGDLVWDVIAIEKDGTAVTAVGQTARWNSGSTNTNEIRGAGGTQPSTSTSTTVGWTNSTKKWAMSGVAVKPASTGSSNSSATYTLTPALCSGLTLPSGGSLRIKVHISNVTGNPNGSTNISAVLKYGSTVIDSLTTPVFAGDSLVFTGSLSSLISIPAGQVITLTIRNNQSGVSFRVDYDSQSKASRIDLPTSTVIRVDSVFVYDAPYPGGSRITSTDNGAVVYVRSWVSDPFGQYDITSLPISVTGPGAYSLIDVADSMAISGCTKIYEYTWQTPTAEGNYNITVTGKEGYENTVSDSKSTTLELKQSDVGTPCELAFTNSSWAPVSTYATGSTLYISLTDADQDTSGIPNVLTVIVTATPNGDVENVTLTETGNHTGVFRGQINSATTNSSGVVHAPEGTSLLVSYTDPNDAGDVCTANALVPYLTPNSNGLVLTKTRTSAVVANIGETVTFDIQLTNVGTQSITQLTLTDTYEPCLTFASASASGYTQGSGTLTWTNAASIVPIAIGQTKTITLTFTANGTSCNPTSNTVNSSNGQYSGGASVDNETDNDTVIITRPLLTLVKSRVLPADSTAAINEMVHYQIVVNNTGSTNMVTVPMNDVYSDFCLEFDSAVPAAASSGGGVIFWNNIGPIAAGNSRTINVYFNGKNGCGNMINTASIFGAIDEYGDSPPDVEDTAKVLLYEIPVIGLAKKETSIVNNGNGTITVTYLLTAKNYGDVALSDIRIFDDIAGIFAGWSPTGYAAISGTFTANAGWDGTSTSNILAAGQTLDTGQSKTVSISFTVSIPSVLVNNTATAIGMSPLGTDVSDVSNNGTDPDPDNDRDPTDDNTPTPLALAADLSVTKSASPDPVSPGLSLTFTIIVKNNGPASASNVTITDNAAAFASPQYSLTGLSPWADWPGSLNIGTLPSSASDTIYLFDTLGMNQCSNVSNTAFASASTPDVITTNDTSRIIVTVNNSSPDAVNDTFTIVENTSATPTSVTNNVLRNDSDSQGQAYSVSSWGVPAGNPPLTGGSLTASGNGVFTYTPPQGYTGTVTFTYTLCDVCGQCDTATVIIQVVACTVPPARPGPINSIPSGK